MTVKKNQRRKTKADSVIEKSRPDFTAWLRNDAFTAKELAALAVGIHPESELADDALGPESEFEKAYGRNAKLLDLRDRYFELYMLIDRSLEGGTLNHFHTFRNGLIPRDHAFSFVVDTGIFCEEFREGIRRWAEREMAARGLSSPANEDAKKRSKRTSEKPLLTRERETALKLIAGMAIAGYSFDPKAARNSASGEIASDIAQLGLSIDEDTVRKWLQEACQILPRS